MKVTKELELPCVMTEEELRLKTQQLAALPDEITRLELAKKAKTTDYATTIKAKQAELQQLAHEVKTGKELRIVACIEQPLYGAEMVETVRTDTHQVVSKRPMNPSERQEVLNIDAGIKRADARRAKAAKSGEPVEEGAH